jgi:hypothetical protein
MQHMITTGRSWYLNSRSACLESMGRGRAKESRLNPNETSKSSFGEAFPYWILWADSLGMSTPLNGVAFTIDYLDVHGSWVIITTAISLFHTLDTRNIMKYPCLNVDLTLTTQLCRLKWHDWRYPTASWLTSSLVTIPHQLGRPGIGIAFTVAEPSDLGTGP